MPSKKNQLRIVARSSAHGRPQPVSAQPPTVSLRWLLTAGALTLVGAVLCAWASLCLLFWQGSWQLLYHPQSAIARTPASVGLPFDAVGFAVTETGQLRLRGWWIPAARDARFSRYTVLFLHGAKGNLGDTVEALARLHAAGVNVFAFDYRGYGGSQFTHPSEASWRQDTGWALDYLTGTRHIDPHTIVLQGDQLGADLALEVAAAHPELAGAVLDSPVENAVSVLFNDPRAHLVPARALVRDQYNLPAAAAALRIPSLWLEGESGAPGKAPQAYAEAHSRKTLVWLNSGPTAAKTYSDALSRWLADLPGDSGSP